MVIYAVDDEELALEFLADAIDEAMAMWGKMDYELVTFSNPQDLIKANKKKPADVLFSDIRMPEMTGMDLVRELSEKSPNLNVIFVTAYNEYAIESIELRVSGYLEKPVSADKILKELQNLRYELAGEDTVSCKISCYGNFEIFDKAGTPVRFHRSKSKEMLAYLVHKKGAFCTIREIAGILFEDDPYDDKQARYMQKIFSTMIADLKDAGCGNIIIHNYNNIAIDVKNVQCDYYDNPDKNSVIMDGGEYMAQYSWGEYM